MDFTNTTTEILTSDCGLQTVGSLLALVFMALFGLSEAMPFVGDSKKNNGVIQTILKVLSYKKKPRVSDT